MARMTQQRPPLRPTTSLTVNRKQKRPNRRTTEIGEYAEPESDRLQRRRSVKHGFAELIEQKALLALSHATNLNTIGLKLSMTKTQLDFGLIPFECDCFHHQGRRWGLSPAMSDDEVPALIEKKPGVATATAAAPKSSSSGISSLSTAAAAAAASAGGGGKDLRSVLGFVSGAPPLTDGRDSNGYTALHWAAYLGNVDQTRALEAAATVAELNDANNQNQQTPVHWAQRWGRYPGFLRP